MTTQIRFLLGDKLMVLKDVDPSMTVLNFLRCVVGRPGSKEGCAEGDCGACTVMLCELRGDDLQYRAVNSCILFLPVLDGKQLVTVEDVKSENGTLHPVQQAMVDSHGSQCGFCTPGFVMSLYTAYQTERSLTRNQVDDVLAGNLCRCTGYSPIATAAMRMYEYKEPSVKGNNVLEQLQDIRRNEVLELNWADRKYYAPASLTEFATLYAQYPNAHILAGGTDVGLWITKQHRDLDTIIYTGGVQELLAIDETSDQLVIGSAVTFSDAHPPISRLYPDFGELIRRFGSVPIRNSATIGGNIANASPIGDAIPPLMALGATLLLNRDGETREVLLDDFFVGYHATILEPGEFIQSIVIPILHTHRLGVYKISKRFDQDISAVCAAVSIDLEGNNVRDVKVCYGGMAEVPKHATECEQALRGKRWTRETVDLAARALQRDFAPISDMRASSEYRMLVAKNLLVKFFIETSAPKTTTRILEYAATFAG